MIGSILGNNHRLGVPRVQPIMHIKLAYHSPGRRGGTHAGYHSCVAGDEANVPLIIEIFPTRSKNQKYRGLKSRSFAVCLVEGPHVGERIHILGRPADSTSQFLMIRATLVSILTCQT